MIKPEEIVPDIKIEISHGCSPGLPEEIHCRITIDGWCIGERVKVVEEDRLGALLSLFERAKARTFQMCLKK